LFSFLLTLGDLGSVEELLEEKSVNINAPGAQNRTALHRAVGKGHDSVTEFLIENGANVNCVDAGNLTPLYVNPYHC
jgi:ankyrin repeat protein